jgi:hypothetical protein
MAAWPSKVQWLRRLPISSGGGATFPGAAAVARPSSGRGHDGDIFFFIFSFFFFSMLIFSQVFSAITEIKPKESNPNLLGSTFSEEPIGPYFLDNRISVKNEEPN